jgi:hypothetical protein
MTSASTAAVAAARPPKAMAPVTPLGPALGADRRGDPLAELRRGLRRGAELGGIGEGEELGDVGQLLDLRAAVRAALEVRLQAGPLVGVQVSQ